jgi:F-type H+-transporting ATPase subunit gamma
MASLQDIRRRIRSVKNTQQVTKAMKMISAVKLRKSQERLLSLRPFATKLHEVVGRVLARFESLDKIPDHSLANAFFSPREEKNIHIVVIAADKGLCGGFNAGLQKAAESFMRQRPGQVAVCDVIGRRAADWARKSGIKTTFEATMVAPGDFTKLAKGIAERAAKAYAAGEIDALYLVFNHFNSAASQSPQEARVFPPTERPAAGSAGIEHLLEPDPETVLQGLLPHYIESEIFRALLESSTSEHAARMAAMDKATSNAAEMIDSLTLHMNKVRQAAITSQIIEVVSGAATS